jgi:hypothetical protein
LSYIVIIVALLDLILSRVVFKKVEGMENFLIFLEKFFSPYEPPLDIGG